MKITKTAYAEDFYAWTQEMRDAIREGRWEDIDREGLADEIDDMGKSERRGVVSKLCVILAHMLKEAHQPEKQTRSWTVSIDTERFELGRLLAENPSLRAQLHDLADEAYARARRHARDETGLPLETFPSERPWSVDEIVG